MKYWRNRVIQVEKEENRVRDNETERRHRGKSINYREDIGVETEKKTDCKTGKEAAEETEGKRQAKHKGKTRKARKDKERQEMKRENET